MDEIKRMLNEEIKTRINDLSGMPTGSSERKETVDEIAKLCGLVNGDDKRKQRIDRFIKYALEVIGIGLPLICYGRWYRQGLRFEKEGIISSKTFGNFLHFIKPTRR